MIVFPSRDIVGIARGRDSVPVTIRATGHAEAVG
jgi:hypothetical protein